MRKKQIIILGVVLGLSLLGLIFTQARYFQTAFQLKKAHFDYLVNKSIDQVTTYLEEKDKQQMAEEKKNEIHHLGKNGVVHEMPRALDLRPGLNVKNDMNIVQPLPHRLRRKDRECMGTVRTERQSESPEFYPEIPPGNQKQSGKRI